MTPDEQTQLATILSANPAYTADYFFREAITGVLEHEGHYVDNAADPGGATNWGISLPFAKALGLDIDHDGTVDARDIRAIDIPTAVALYHENWWLKYGYGQLPGGVAVKLLDEAVPKGQVAAVKILQRALRACGAQHIDDDGALGKGTRDAISYVASISLDIAALRNSMRSESAGHYRLIVAHRPESARFLQGWLNRAYS